MTVTTADRAVYDLRHGLVLCGHCFRSPLLLWQIWLFISPALYKHETAYVTPFIGLSSISFVIGAAFAYYILFPPAASYLLGVGGTNSSCCSRRTTISISSRSSCWRWALIFQMPAITYVLATDRAGFGRLADPNVENIACRHFNSCGRCFADRRHSEHAAVCGADDSLIRGLDIYRLVFRQETRN